MENKAFKIITDQMALEYLNDRKFQKKWHHLQKKCTWSTPFQGVEFALAWFTSYHKNFTPIFLLEEGEDQQLKHLFILAFDKQHHQFVPCGTHQAEYQCWLSHSFDFKEFLSHSFSALKNIAPRQNFTLFNIPPVLAKFIQENPTEIPQPHISNVDQKPIVQFDQEPSPWKSMSKKSNKSKLARMKKSGLFDLDLISFSSPEKHQLAEEHLSQISLTYDLRQGALNNCLPFKEDPVKFEFTLKLLTETNIFEILAITINNTIVASIVGSKTSTDLCVGIFSYSPFLAKHSPGKLLVLLGTKLLNEKGFKFLDLTPGGEWKWRFANKSQDVLNITFFATYPTYFQEFLKQQTLKSIKFILKTLNIRPESLKKLIAKLKKISPHRIGKKIAALCRPKKINEYRIYRFSAEKARLLKPKNKINCNNINDFLEFTTVESWHNKQQFLKGVLRNFEAGEIGYSYSEKNTLSHSGWLIPYQKKAFFSEIQQEYYYPEPGSVLYDFYTDPSARGQGLYQQSLTRMLKDASNNPDINYIYISVLADNKPSRHVIEKLKFEYIESLYG